MLFVALGLELYWRHLPFLQLEPEIPYDSSQKTSSPFSGYNQNFGSNDWYTDFACNKTVGQAESRMWERSAFLFNQPYVD